MRIAIKPLPGGGAVSYFRGTGPGAELSERGHQVAYLHSQHVAKEKQPELVRTADVVHILGHRAQTMQAEGAKGSGHWKDAPREFHERHGVLSMDLDDDLWSWLDDPAKTIADEIMVKAEVEPAVVKMHQDRVAEVESWLEAADVVTTTTPYLRDVIRSHVPKAHVSVCPNAITEQMQKGGITRAQNKRQASEALKKAGLLRPMRVVGWSGSVAHVPDLTPLLESLACVRRVDGSLVVRSLGPVDFMFSPGFRSVFDGQKDYQMMLHRDASRPDKAPQPIVPFEFYYDFLETMAPNVAVIPMRDSPLNRSKSPVTLYSWSVQGVPVVCSDTGPYRAARDEGFPAVYVPHLDVEAWTHELRELLYEPAKALALGERAREWVLSHHNAPEIAKAWEATWEEAVARRKASRARLERELSQ